MSDMERNVFWSNWNMPGLQHLQLLQSENEIIAIGTILSLAENIPFHATYRILCDNQWHVRTVQIALIGSQTPSIQLRTDGKGHWTNDTGNAIPSLDGCIDIDISATPFTNTLPIRRLHLAKGVPSDIAVVYIKVPELTLQSMQQRYTCLEHAATGGAYHYEGPLHEFRADLPVDQDGLVLDYPELFRRVG